MKNLFERLLDAAHNLATLKVTTVVGDMTVVVVDDGGRWQVQPPKLSPTAGEDPPAGQPQDKSYGMTGSAIITQIDLIQGDITTVIDKKFENPSNPMRQVHEEQVDRANSIIRTNIAVLKELGEILESLPKDMKERPGPNAG